jgi:hypothetical protein
LACIVLQSQDGTGLVFPEADSACPSEIRTGGSCTKCTASIRGLEECVYCLISEDELNATSCEWPEEHKTKCTRLCSPGTAAGDAQPLKIYPAPAFAYAAIGQTQHRPFRANLLTITLETNIVLDRLYSAAIHISNLDIIDDEGGMVELYSDRVLEEGEEDNQELRCFPGDPCDLFRACVDPVVTNRCPKATAAWDNLHKVLRLYVANKLPIVSHRAEEGRPLSFSLRLFNGPQSDRLAEPSVSGYGVSQTGSTVDVIDPKPVPTGLGFTWFAKKNIGQNNPYPKALNTLTITLEATQTISPDTGAAISVIGLMGKSWPGDTIELTDPTGDNMHLRFMNAFPMGTRGSGGWCVCLFARHTLHDLGMLQVL